MEKLQKKYRDAVQSIIDDLQKSELLQQYLEEEESEQYRALQAEYEPLLQQIYDHVANHYPLQLIALEDLMLDEGLEGMFLPRILGHTVLRGHVTEDIKYHRPQEHFKQVLDAICASANFDLISQRIGQSIQVGFSLSSDIWITNLIEQYQSKRIRSFLMNQIPIKYREQNKRAYLLRKYKSQFETHNFLTAKFPDNVQELRMFYPELKTFLIYRYGEDLDNKSLDKYIVEFIENKTMAKEEQYKDMLLLLANLYEGSDEVIEKIFEKLNGIRKSDKEFNTFYFDKLNQYLKKDFGFNEYSDMQVSGYLSRDIADDMNSYYTLCDQIHGTGFVDEKTINDVRKFYYGHEGLSNINDSLREVIMRYFRNILNNLDTDSFEEYFSFNPFFKEYIDIFSNQKFNQELKRLILSYVKRLLKVYKDKRSKDYQDIKKFVVRTFVEQGFMKEKEILEIFKTRRTKVAK